MSSAEATELLEAVRLFLREEVLPELEGFKAYNTRVAANALRIAAREIDKTPEREALDKVAVQKFELQDAEGSAASRLAKKIRDGEQEVTPELISWLKRHCLLRMAVDNPRYSGFQQASQQWTDL